MLAALFLALAVSTNWADDKPKADPPATKTLAQQLDDLKKEFDTEFRKVLTEFREAKPDERAKVRDRAFKLPETYATKFMEIAEANSKDPVAVKALLWVATVPGSRGLPPPPQSKVAIDRLIKDYSESPVMVELCPMLEGHPDGERRFGRFAKRTPASW
jgi:hypothetical protein